MAKNQAKTKQHIEVELLLSENYSLCSSTLSFKNNRRHSKKCAKGSVSILIGLYMIDYDENESENEMKMKNRSHIYDTNKPRHGHNHFKYKMCQSTRMVICIKQHLSNTRSSVYEKVRQH